MEHTISLTFLQWRRAALLQQFKEALLLHQTQHLPDVIQRQVVAVLHVGIDFLHVRQLMLGQLPACCKGQECHQGCIVTPTVTVHIPAMSGLGVRVS